MTRTIAVQAANGTLNPQDREILASQVENYLEEMVGNGNISYAGKYLFAGTQTLTRLFALEKETSQSRLIRTGNPLDMAIEGEGYFQLVKFDDEGHEEIFYTRVGNCHIEWDEESGRIVNSQGIPLLVTDEDGELLEIPRDYRAIEIGQD